MRVAFFDTKPYDKIWFEPLAAEYGYDFDFYEYRLDENTVRLIDECDAVCAFVNDTLNKRVINALAEKNIKVVLMRCAGYNNVDLKAAEGKVHILRVPNYSPYAVAEHSMALLLTLCRKTHKAYNRTRENNFNISGLMGTDLNGKNVGIIGTGKIGQVFADICAGFNMQIFGYDPYPQKSDNIKFLDLDELFEKSDFISLHCPLTKETRHIINSDSISKMKDGVYIINTSRGGLIDTSALIEGLKERKIGAAGLDVYEEEGEYFFEDFSNEIIDDDTLARLLTFPNVLVTSHQGFFTREAMQSIAIVTMENLRKYAEDGSCENEVKYKAGSSKRFL